MAVLLVLVLLHVQAPVLANGGMKDDHAEAAGMTIDELERYRDDLSAAQKKLSTDLLGLVDARFLPPGVTTAEQKVLMAQQRQYASLGQEVIAFGGITPPEQVHVYISLREGADPRVLAPYARAVNTCGSSGRMVAAWVNLALLEVLAGRDDVLSIDTVTPPYLRTGSVTSVGDSIHRSMETRAWYGIDGSGIKVGVISDTVHHIADAIASGDLPADVDVLRDDDPYNTGTDEGIAMLEVIHDLAPGASLAFHDMGLTMQDFCDAIDALAAAGCDIICDDVGFYEEAAFEDGIIAAHMRDVNRDEGILFVSSAGNHGPEHYQGSYSNNGQDYHDFSEGAGSEENLRVKMSSGESIIIVLQWDDPWYASAND
ncbi:MAG: S8 family serine peptidase, partial [Methanomicrobiales archaeon]|nr:S8 family serine peptidase [Methanomicrobiales archaeon]